MTLTKLILRSEYPNLDLLRKYASQVFQKSNDLVVMNGDIVSRDYKTRYGIPLKNLSYDKLAEILIYYDKISQESEEKRKSGIHTINDYENNHEYTVKHVYDQSSSSSIWYIIFLILLIIFIIYILYKIFQNFQRMKNVSQLKFSE